MLRRFLWLFLFFSVSCGFATGSLNEPVPSGTLISQGTFSGDASGRALIYRQGTSAPYTYVLRLENLSAPDETTHIRVRNATDSVDSILVLRSTSGQQNYTLSSTGVLTWTTVYLQDNANPMSSTSIATANLISI